MELKHSEEQERLLQTAKKILEEQLQLLSEASKGNVFDELPRLTSAMIDVVKTLLTIGP